MTAFQRALERLAARTNYERTRPDSPKAFGLKPMQELWAALGHPADVIPTLHIAGTKGKGSTSWYCGALVRSTGLRVGVYTSPHLVSPCERITVNGEPVSEEAFAMLADEVLGAAEALEGKGGPSPTWFDLMTGMALRHFADSRVHVMVLETGLGGRLDSTNICKPRCSVITRIGLDHTEVLGDSLAAIAMEKAGIIKPEIPVVTCQQDPDVMRVILETARLKQSPCHVLGRDMHLSQEADGMDLDTGTAYHTGLVKAAAGHHQWENAALAVKAVELTGAEVGFTISEQDVRFALSQTVIPGRLQTWDDLLIDCAHNPLSMAACADGLRDLELSDLRLIYGMNSDKDARASLKCLRGRVSRVWCVPLESGRSADPESLARMAREELGCEARAVGSVDEALDQSRATVAEGPILVTGSVYLVGDVLRICGSSPAGESSAT